MVQLALAPMLARLQALAPTCRLVHALVPYLLAAVPVKPGPLAVLQRSQGGELRPPRSRQAVAVLLLQAARHS